MDGIHIRCAEPEDGPQIADLFRGGFRSEIAQLLVYGSSGAGEYIRMQIAAPAPAESAYFVAQAPDGMAGAAELRRRANWLLLNYIAVRPVNRGQGIATRLLAEAIRMSGVLSGQIELDVLDDNVQSLRWYRRLGFEAGTSAEYIELAPPTGACEDSAYVSGLPQADLCQARFGFSKFDLITGTGTFSIGRIGDAWFRMLDPAAAGSPAACSALRRLDPRRRFFAVVPSSAELPASAVRLLAKTHRMETAIRSLVSALSYDRQKSHQPV